jgi:PHP family Zn ribbon phosphoesterase
MKKGKHKMKKNKINILKELIQNDKNWRNYLSSKTTNIVEKLIETNNVMETSRITNSLYITIHSNLIKAIDRITKKETTFKREGRTSLSIKLFELMEGVEDWETYVTPEEAKIAKCFKEQKNFYEVSRRLNLKPSNVASALYGNTQRFGVITKLKNKIVQKKRFIKKEVKHNEF